MSSKKRRKKPRTTEWYRKRAVTKAKKLARQRDDYRCWYCGEGEPQRRTHGSHIFSEGVHKSMSADLDNIKTLCAIHHSVMPGWGVPPFNWHAHPAESIIWFKGKYPELWDKLKKRSQVIKKMTELDWIKKWEELKEYESTLP